MSVRCEKSSTNDVNQDNDRVEESSTPSSCNDVSSSCDRHIQASDRPEKLERHQEAKVGLPETRSRETGVTVWCTECVKKGYSGHRCCDDVPGISRGPHQQASS